MFKLFKHARSFSSIESIPKTLKNSHKAAILLTSTAVAGTVFYYHDYYHNNVQAAPPTQIQSAHQRIHNSFDDFKNKYSVIKADDQTYEQEVVEILKSKLESLEVDKSAKHSDIVTVLMLLYSHLMAMPEKKKAALAFYERALDLQSEQTKGRIEILDKYDDIALMARRFDLDEAIRLNLKAIEKKQAQLGKNTPFVVRNYINLAEIYLLKGQSDKSNEYLNKSRFTMEYFDNDETRCDTYFKECQNFNSVKEYYYSNEYCEKTLECFHRYDKNDTKRKARCAETIIENSVALEDYEKALNYTEIKNEFLDGKDETYYKTKGRVYIEMSKKSQASNDIPKTVEYQTNAALAYENVPGESEKFQLYIIYRNLAKNLKTLGHKERAKAILEKAKEKSVFPDTDESIQQELRELESKPTGLILGALAAIGGATYFLFK